MAGQTVEEMEAKVVLGSMLIKMLAQEEDPRAPAAIETLQGQLRELEVRIKAEQPSPVVVSCNAAVLSGKASGSPALQREGVQVVEMVSEVDGNIELTLQY